MSATGAGVAGRPDRGVQLAVLGMLFTVLIYGSNFPITRHATLNGLSPYDLTALRFIVAGALLLPLFLRAGVRDCAGIGWGRGLVLTLLSGVPLTLLMINGLAIAPAAHGASIAPGTVTIIGAVGSVLMFGTNPTRNLVLGIAIVIGGLACIGIAGSSSGLPNAWLGDLCFLGVGLLWGGYPLLIQKWRVKPLNATAVLSVISAVYLPYYFLFCDVGIFRAPLGVVLFHAINQGVFNVIIGLWIWGWAAGVLGASVVGRFPPLIPVIGTVLAIPILSEWPKPLQVVGVALIVSGLFLTTLRRSTANPVILPRG